MVSLHHVAAVATIAPRVGRLRPAVVLVVPRMVVHRGLLGAVVMVAAVPREGFLFFWFWCLVLLI